MKVLLPLFASVLLALLGGCTTPSLNPLATPETVVGDADIVGTWIDPEDANNTYIVTAAGENAYELKCIPKDTTKRPLEFSFQIVKLMDSRFIDLTVTRGAMDQLNEKYGTVVVPAHVFMKMKRKGDQLTVWQVKNDWLNEGLKSGDIKLAHATIREFGGDKETYVLTGPTTELQAFIRKNVDNDEAWEKPGVFQRDTGDKAGAEKKKPAAK